MTDFALRYRSAFEAQLRDPGEGNLQAAYDLGREAVERGSSILDLAMAHHAALSAALRPGGPGGDVTATVQAAEDFFLESVSAFEMVQRGFLEARDSAAAERAHAELLRQLSAFLADASLALSAADSRLEMLRLVCEQACELMGAEGCLLTTGIQAQPRFAAASLPEDDLTWRAFARWLDLTRLDDAVRSSGAVVRMWSEELSDRLGAAAGAAARRPDLRDHVGTALRALDGRAIGSLHLFNKIDGTFTVLDEAVVAHLAQMAAAALERSELYV
ncbi:MAG: hypothetical protein AVDCRST_MAG69-2709 [uncultured Solirubrobacteraceae bacterium]|uniref:Phosphoserine phosphatase RsbU N-terminal domain-containing protein n=1 Tax=uncultured Solirubrobacteraceae bacterium TaxID=1162706 RepID=A0A6J4T693_9ACTN|nr:MAG: hypothetical protein AVDCRST_MAG69-2709 [uncultured Solirubrobacteraceae bacterium]